MCSVNQICPRPRTPLVGLPRFPANAAHADGGFPKGAANMDESKIRNPSRFLKRVSEITPNERGCLIWSGAKDGNGYGTLQYRKRTFLAHRYAYEQHIGAIPAGMLVCHRCDTPPCVNTEHMFLGTLQDNMDDRNSKSRQAKGERGGRTKISEQAVREIKANHKNVSALELAARFGISRCQVYVIRSGLSWRHIK